MVKPLDKDKEPMRTQRKNMQTEREETRVNETREVLIFACNWLREWREFSGPITERSKAKPSNPELLSTLN